MSAKHTQSPWRVFNGTDVFPDDNDISASRHIADCNMAGSIGGDEQRANARLIAAAPEMLQALKRLLCTAEMELVDADHALGVYEARAAIAKATGSVLDAGNAA